MVSDEHPPKGGRLATPCEPLPKTSFSMRWQPDCRIFGLRQRLLRLPILDRSALDDPRRTVAGAIGNALLARRLPDKHR
jgi:hypothetical protein